jgi:MFS family permease
LISALADLLDAVPLPAIPAVLLALFLLAAELGFACHRRYGGAGGGEDESQVLSTALLVLALLLGFTFSMALDRYDERRQLVVQEANDIGTAWLRAGLVPAPHGPALQNALRDYAVLRQSSPLPHETAKLARAAEQRNRVWRLTAAAQAALDGPRAVSLVTAVNAVLDTGTQREKAVAARVPGEVMLLLVLFAAVACFLLGYVLDAHGARHRLASSILFLLMGLTIMLILDLDRPVDGAILVDQSAMQALVQGLAPAAVAAQ